MNEIITKYEAIFDKYEINTPLRQAMFLAQCSHESAGFKCVVENLNYSSDGLLKVFKKYFNEEQAQRYARKPHAIANRVYANRMGNGDEASGDGFKYRGRGYIQLTGKNNYTAFAKHLNRELDSEFLEYCESEEGALVSACYFWQRENLNDLADKGEIKECTKKINGGYNGLEDRIKKYEAFKKLLGI